MPKKNANHLRSGDTATINDFRNGGCEISTVETQEDQKKKMIPCGLSGCKGKYPENQPPGGFLRWHDETLRGTCTVGCGKKLVEQRTHYFMSYKPDKPQEVSV